MIETPLAFQSDGHGLVGTLTLPEHAQPAPAVILASGSGAHDRDETVCGHKPFKVIAEALSHAGRAVLRFDDRGVGDSSGDAALTRFDDSVADLVAAFDALGRSDGIDESRIAFVGHSEGGLTALAAAARRPAAQGVVMLGGPAQPIEALLHDQARTVSREGGASEAQIGHERRMNEAVFALARQDGEGASERIAEVIADHLQRWPDALEWSPDEVRDTAVAMAEIIGAPAYRSLLKQEPVRLIQATKQPIMALFGGLDTQVPADPNLKAFLAATAGRANTEARVFNGLNHLFQAAETGSIMEYEALGPGPTPDVLDVVSSWLERLPPS